MTGRRRQEVTVLFTDIRDFTTISERQSPEDVTSQLSDYFQVMNEIVEAHNGVIIQYLGDSICAMWNAPTSDAEHRGAWVGAIWEASKLTGPNIME